MAKNGKKESGNGGGLRTQTKHGILAVVFFVFALFFLMSMPPFRLAGVAGNTVYDILNYLLGVGYILFPALLVLMGSSFLKNEAPNIGWRSVISGGLFLLSGLGVIDIASGKHSGGLLGEILSTPFIALFDTYASIIFLGAILIISILVMFDAKLDFSSILERIKSFLFKKKLKPEPEEEEYTDYEEAPTPEGVGVP